MIAGAGVVVTFEHGVQPRVDVDKNDVKIEVDQVVEATVVELLLGDSIKSVEVFSHLVSGIYY
jgi:hypothetical protein